MEIAGLSAGIVPHCQWPFRQWFYAPGRRYYHCPRVRRHSALSPRIYEYMDPAIRELCRLLHARGVRTTASCQGHDHDRGHFERRWKSLCEEARVIREGGLLVTESEGGETLCFRDPDYRLPWTDFSQFWQASRRHQSTGYLGFIVPRAEEMLHRRLRTESHRLGNLAPRFDAAMARRLGGHLYHITVESVDPGERWGQWRYLTEWVRHELVTR